MEGETLAECKFKPDEVSSKSALSIYAIGIPALLYFLGWMNLFYYLDYFGVYIFSIDIPFHFFFIYSFSVFKFAISAVDNVIDVRLLSALFLGLLLYVWLFCPQLKTDIPATINSLTMPLRHPIGAVFLLFILFVLGHLIAQADGITQAENLRANPQPLVKVFPKPSKSSGKKSADGTCVCGAQSSPPDPFSGNGQFDVNTRVTVAFATKTRYFVLVQRLATEKDVKEDGKSTKYRPEAEIVEISASEIAYLTTKLQEMIP